MIHCKKCPFFVKKTEDRAAKGAMIMGFCKMREKFVTDESINNELCKDRAVVDPQSVESMDVKRDDRDIVTF
jgi:hypothetical protein